MTRHGNSPVLSATTNYGLRTAEQQRPAERVTCPVPGCGRYVALTMSGYLEWHANGHGFICDGVNLSPAQAACLQIDEAGRLVTLFDTGDPFDFQPITDAQESMLGEARHKTRGGRGVVGRLVDEARK